MGKNKRKEQIAHNVACRVAFRQAGENLERAIKEAIIPEILKMIDKKSFIKQ